MRVFIKKFWGHPLDMLLINEILQCSFVYPFIYIYRYMYIYIYIYIYPLCNILDTLYHLIPFSKSEMC